MLHHGNLVLVPRSPGVGPESKEAELGSSVALLEYPTPDPTPSRPGLGPRRLGQDLGSRARVLSSYAQVTSVEPRSIKARTKTSMPGAPVPSTYALQDQAHKGQVQDPN